MNATELFAAITGKTDAVTGHEVLHGQLAIAVDPSRWVEVATLLRDEPLLHFDFPTFLTAVDQEADGFDIVANLYSVRRGHRVFLTTRVSRDAPHLATLSSVWSGMNWCERETWELFGVIFDGHPNLVKLLLPVEFDGFPLRKDFLLMTREAKEWPGEKEPA